MPDKMLAVIAMGLLTISTSAWAQAGEEGHRKPHAAAHGIAGRASSAGAVDKAAPTAPASYTFTLNSFQITDTRALHNDTDLVSISVAVGGKPPITLPVKSMGDVNNGGHQVNLSIPNVVVNPGELVDFSYSIVNSGHDQDAVSKAIQQALGQAAGQGVTAGCGEVGGDPKTCAAIGPKAGSWLVDQVFPDCDGPVAAADHKYNSAWLTAKVGGGTFSATDENKGTNSPVGCGRNSRYLVTWSVSSSNATGGASARGGGGGGGAGGPGGNTHRVRQ
jgi:hypothetical protein